MSAQQVNITDCIYGRVEASPRGYCVGDLRAAGDGRGCCTHHPEILLPSQPGDVQILGAEGDGGAGIRRDRRRPGVSHSGGGLGRGSPGIILRSTGGRIYRG